MKTPTIEETFATLYPATTLSPELDNRLERLVAKAEAEHAGKQRQRFVRRAFCGAALAGVVAVAFLAAPRVALAVQLFDAARLLENGGGLCIEEQNLSSGAVERTWASRAGQRRERGSTITLWRDGTLYTWTRGQTEVMARRGVEPLGTDVASLLRMLGSQSLLSLLRREYDVAEERVGEQGRTLRRLTLRRRGDAETARVYFAEGQAIPTHMDLIAPDGAVRRRSVLTLMPVNDNLLRLPTHARVRDLDQAEQEWLTSLPQQKLIVAASPARTVTIRDAAVAPNGDVFLLFTSPAPARPMVVGESFQQPDIRLQDAEGRTWIQYSLPTGPHLSDGNDVHLRVYTSAQPHAPLPYALQATIKIPQSTEATAESSAPAPQVTIPVHFPVRRLTTDAPEYAAYPGIHWDPAEPSRQLERLNAQYGEACRSADWDTAIALSDRLLETEAQFRATQGHRFSMLSWHLSSRAKVLRKLGRTAEATAVEERIPAERALEQKR